MVGGDSLPIPRIAVGDSAEAKRAAYAEFLLSCQAALSEQGGGSPTTTSPTQTLDAVAAMATVSFLLSRLLPHSSWSGFYRSASDDDGSLVVGPYVGNSMGCLRIAPGRGVCGAAAAQCRSVVVPDVSAFPGHIACSSATRSELVVPVFEGGGGDPEGGEARVVAVIDLDSEHPAAFDAADAAGIETLARWMGEAFFSSEAKNAKKRERGS